MATTKKTVKGMKARVWDALAKSAKKYRGIGKDMFEDEKDRPCCIFGHAKRLPPGLSFDAQEELRSLDVSYEVNDEVVARLLRPGQQRVGFARLMKELGIVRGASRGRKAA